jgi:hypothetical protein
LAPQTTFKLGHQVFGEAQVLQSVLEGLSGPLCLASVPLKALVSFEAVALSGFGVLFGVSVGWGHGELLGTGWI